MGTGCFLGGDENVLGLLSGDGCTTLYILKPLNVHFIRVTSK